jgi:hypothetical protein
LDKEKKNDIVSYNRNRRCRTSTTEERPFDENFHLVGNRDYDIQDVKKNARKFMGVDLATKKRRGTAITVVGTDGRLNYVLDVVVGAWKITEKVAKIREYYEIYQPELIYVENNALQDDIVDALNVADNSNLPIKPFTTGVAKHSSIERLAMELDNDKWRFNYPSACQDVIDGKSVDDSDWSRFLMEIKMYPDYPSNDMLMSWMFASEALKKNTSRDIQIGIINLNDDADDDDFFDRPTHVFGFKDYQLGNRISQTRGVIIDSKYQQIISYIKSNIRENQIVRDESDIPYDFKEFMSVFEDMTYFCDTMNGKRLH